MRYEIIVCDNENPKYEVSGNDNYYVVENGNFEKKEGTKIDIPMYDFNLTDAYKMLHQVEMNFHIVEKVRMFVYSSDEASKIGLLFWTVQ